MRSTYSEHRKRGQRVSARERHMRDIAVSVRDNVASDFDVSGYAYEVSNSVSDLLQACDIRKVKNQDEYTQTLVGQYVTFVTGDDIGIGGSSIDYCAWKSMDAFDGYKIRLRDNEYGHDILRRLGDSIRRNAIYPDREMRALEDAGIDMGGARDAEGTTD